MIGLSGNRKYWNRGVSGLYKTLTLLNFFLDFYNEKVYADSIKKHSFFISYMVLPYAYAATLHLAFSPYYQTFRQRTS